jgi:hypothetical protein
VILALRLTFVDASDIGHYRCSFPSLQPSSPITSSDASGEISATTTKKKATKVVISKFGIPQSKNGKFGKLSRGHITKFAHIDPDITQRRAAEKSPQSVSKNISTTGNIMNTGTVRSPSNSTIHNTGGNDTVHKDSMEKSLDTKTFQQKSRDKTVATSKQPITNYGESTGKGIRHRSNKGLLGISEESNIKDLNIGATVRYAFDAQEIIMGKTKEVNLSSPTRHVPKFHFYFCHNANIARFTSGSIKHSSPVTSTSEAFISTSRGRCSPGMAQ